MKLIDLLVRELPKRGGWPDGVKRLEQDSEGQFFEMESDYCSEFALQKCESWIDDAVTKSQYEAALAAIKPQWNGEGVPPVGVECEYSLNAGRTWFKCKIDYVLGTQGLIMLADVYEGGQFVGFAEYDGKLKFRPIRSEADKKRDAVTKSILDVINDYDLEMVHIRSDQKRIATDIVERIASGMIPHTHID